jgi:amino acid adenylation domain-containing protein
LSAVVLLSQLRSLGVAIVVEEGRLRVNAARGQLTSELKSAIAAQKTELLALLADNANDVSAAIARVDHSGPLPLSFFQERLWVLHRFEPESTAYNMVATWTSPGKVDSARMVEAIHALVRRHEMLRACFRDDDGVPAIILAGPGEVPIEVRDIRDRTPEAQHTAFLAAIDQAKHTPFDLRRKPPVRFLVFEVDGDRVATIVVGHHIAFDAWSFAILGRDITAAFDGATPAVPAESVGYVEFAAWQRATLNDGTLRSELAWWQQKLGGCPKTSTLPAERPRSRAATGATRSCHFTRELSDELRALVREERATLYMALLSACAIVLRWYTGQDDLVLGSPMGLRERPEFESVIGPFVNLLVLRLDLSGDPTFAELLGRARGAVLDAHDHRQVPFEKLVEHLNPERAGDHSPLFQVAVVHQNAAAEGVKIESGGSLFDLTWFVRDVDGELAGGLEYRSDIYSARTIDDVATRLETVLGRVVVNRHQRLSDLSLLRATEESRVNATAHALFKAGTLFELPGADDLAYFRGKLGRVAALTLPADRSRTAPREGRRGRLAFEISWAAFAAVERLARAEQATPFVVLLSAFEVLLYRHSGQTDVALGALPPDDEESATTLPLRVRFTPDGSFVDLLRSVRAAVTEARAHARVPERLEAALDDDAELGKALAVTFAMTPAVEGTAPRRAANPHAELALHLIAGAHDAQGELDYDADLFDEATVRRLVAHYGTLLEGVTASPKIALVRVPLMTRVERDELVAAALQNLSGRAPHTPVIVLFETRARLAPEAPAIVDDVASLSYDELDSAANALARRLLYSGAGPGMRVAVSLPRGPAVVVALLAVLKVRAAYVPLDPNYPPERSGYVLQDAEPAVLLTEESVLGRLPVPAGVTALSVQASEIIAARAAPPGGLPPADPDAIAYVIYTSGSTGRPKGVEVPNRALTNFLASMQHTPGLTADDLLLSVTTISFDIAGLEIFLPLVTGARLRIVPRDIAVDGVRLAALLDGSGATVMQATPATWRVLVEGGWKGHRGLKVLCGGEAMPRHLAEELLERAGSVWNVYGPTETTIWSTVHRVQHADGPVPIGKPIDHTAVYVLDARGEPVPIGVPGEIYIGGEGVARGYANRPELTAERFLPDPFAGGDARMYRTGDAGRLTNDGTLQHLGRLDDQVKVRGHRIELGEIESVLRDHPGIMEAVVAARELAPGDIRLTGYYSERNGAVSARELRELCQGRLPNEMVPTSWMRLASIPRTPNGKTDRNALPAPTPSADDGAAERVPPRTALEVELARIWEAVLGVPVPSVQDSFFDLGGHSLLATRVFARIEQVTGVALPLSALVEKPTIEYLAERISERRVAPRSDLESRQVFSYLVGIQPRGEKAPLFCVHGAGGNVLNLHDIVRYLSPDRPFYGIQAAGVDGSTPPMQSIEEMAARYLLELRALQPRGPYYLSGYCGGGVVAYEMAQRLRVAGEEVALLALIDLYRPGLAEPFSRRQRWTRTLREETVRGLLNRLRLKAFRDGSAAAQQLRVLYHLARGETMPYDLRDFWLTSCFLDAVQRYRLRPYAGQLTVFRAREGNPLFGDPGPDLGWGVLAGEGVATYEIPGDHHTVTREPNVQVLAAHLEACLRSTEKGARAPSVRPPPRVGGSSGEP